MPPHPDPLVPYAPDLGGLPAPDREARPDGFVVATDAGHRVHFLAWGGPADAPGVLLVPGLLQAASAWAPVARRLVALRRVVVGDLRGHGLSDAPFGAYGPAALADDLVAVAEGGGILDGPRPVVAGLGAGAAAAAELAARLGDRCAGLVLVDGGWERLEQVTGLGVDELLRGLDEPPEVLRSLDAYLADRRAWDPATWDEDQEAAARDAVVETAAGRVVRAVRPHVVEAVVRGLAAWDPAPVLAATAVPVTALVALGATETAATGRRLEELRRAGEARRAAGRAPIGVLALDGVGHHLPRHRPDEVAATILGAGL